MRHARRIEDVQAPIIPIIGDLIRRNPGTISLGQGIVSYGPPAGSARGRCGLSRARWPTTATARSKAPRSWWRRIARKLARENGIDVGPDRRIVVTAGGNMAFVNAVLAVTDPGDEVILAGAVLLQPRHGDRDGRVPHGGGADRRSTTSCGPTPSARPSRRARARSSPSRPTTRAAPSTRRRRCAR